MTGPFTVESLSPHRTISAEEKKRVGEQPNSAGFTIKLLAGGGFVNNILDNSRKAGVQNTIKNQRLKFDSLDVFPGQWIAGDGRFSDDGGKEKRVAVCIGPEHGTVGQTLIVEAAKEAVKGVGFDMLRVCGFAFDPMVNEKARLFGKLDVLMVRMNPDLSMGDELLLKTGAGNLFTLGLPTFHPIHDAMDLPNRGLLVPLAQGFVMLLAQKGTRARHCVRSTLSSAND